MSVETIALLSERFGDRALIGAGTVMSADQVRLVAERGGELIVMPHSDAALVAAAKQQGLICVPGVATPSEAFAALNAGADALKLFPAEALPPAVVRAWRAVVPREVMMFPVGGIRPESMAPYIDAGATGFGLGSALFRPGMAIDEIEANAKAFATAYTEIDRRQ
jgi:2-dehydro-3-deoxyphosphogalactonate aldolase